MLKLEMFCHVLHSFRSSMSSKMNDDSHWCCEHNQPVEDAQLKSNHTINKDAQLKSNHTKITKMLTVRSTVKKLKTQDLTVEDAQSTRGI